MKVWDRIFRRSPAAGYQSAPLLDHVPVSQSDDDWRSERLREAAEKYGRPFKCAGSDLPHELLNVGTPRVNAAGRKLCAVDDPCPQQRVWRVPSRKPLRARDS